jgi:hypothetical protein
MAIDLAELGFTQEQLQDRVVEGIIDRLTISDGGDDSELFRRLENVVEEKINEAVESLANKHVLPNVTKYLENLCLQETNKYGEKKGEKKTFIEYLVARAEHYMTEKVNFQGKVKSEDSYQWRESTTRISYLIHEHLHYHIENAMKEAMKNANDSIIGGIEKAVKMKLTEVAEKFNVKVATGRD